MSEKKRELTKEELEDIEWEKAGFTRAEIEEMDRRANEPSILFTSDEILKEFGYKDILY